MAMGAMNRALLALLMVVVLGAVVRRGEAAVYKVGDSAGWTTIANVDYKQWAAVKTFKVGDAIHFEYNPQFHNVMRATHAMYRGCNASAPLATYTTGNDTITINTKGHHYFFCGVPGHCQAGQKVDINVIRSSTTAAALAPAPSDDGLVPAAGAHAPPPSSAFSVKAATGVAQLGFSLASLIVFVLCFF